MRRNAEDLIVLSGAEPARRWSQPVPLVDVVRAALAEVEDYNRVELLPIDDIGVGGQAVRLLFADFGQPARGVNLNRMGTAARRDFIIADNEERLRGH